MPESAFSDSHAMAPSTVLPNRMVPPAVWMVRLAVSVTAPLSWIVPAPVAMMLEPMDEVPSTRRIPPEMSNAPRHSIPW